MPTDQEIIVELDKIQWAFAPEDLDAARNMAKRIARTGRLGSSFISYSNLVEGLTFTLPTVNDGQPFMIDTHNWTGLDRQILGDFLGYISTQSFKTAGFRASCLVVGLKDNQPSEVYFDWMKDLNILSSKTEAAVLKYWSHEVRKAIAWYKANPKGFDL